MSSAPGPSPKRPATAPDAVVCAIGDIHGRLDLTEAAVTELRRLGQEAAAEHKTFTAVFLGDYIDRGPDSRGVVSALLAFAHNAPGKIIFLRGNHEQVLLDVIEGGVEAAQWVDFGGTETLNSYGVEASQEGALDGVGQRLSRALPAEHLEFFRHTEFYAQSGDYLFVHAGLRPDRLLEEQSEADMLWFRYYADEPPVHGRFIVHGHSPHARPINGKSRIAIDTEAYASDALTILRLDGEARDFIKVRAANGGVPNISHWEGIDAAYGRRTRPPSRPAPAPVAAPPERKQKKRGAGFKILAVGAVAGIAALTVFVLILPLMQAGERPQPKRPTAAPLTTAAPVAIRPTTAPSPRDDQPVVARQPLTAKVEAKTPVAPPLAPPVKAAAPTGGAKVQIGAFPSAAAARQAFDALGKTFPSQIASKSLEVETAIVGSRTFYRANVAGFPALQDANAFCRALKTGGKACLVKPASLR